MSRMLLVLKRSAAAEQALQGLIAEQQDRGSANYHKWLTPEEVGQQFGPSDADIQTITSWLQSHGFQVAGVAKGRTTIEFSGTARQVEAAFHTSIRKYVVNGEEHWANAANPEIPTALTPVVAGVATLHNFTKKPQIVKTQAIEAAYQEGTRPEINASSGAHALGPGDFAVIYNINPLYSMGIRGYGVTIGVVARSNINVQDVATFRQMFGLFGSTPQVIVNGRNPGVLGQGEESEAVLDATWAGAVAPGALVDLVVSASTNTTDGVDLSEEYIIDNNLADVMTESFGSCEASYTQAEAAQISALAEQAAVQGITYTVAAGDSGSAGCDDPSETSATKPLSVNILASTAYNIAVGGTEFNENGNNAAYWSTSNTTTTALSYIPENVWNESCTGTQCGGSTAGLWAGGGGSSIFVPKPTWQSGVTGIPADGLRYIPDVSLTAAGHDPYLVCLDGSCQPDSRGRIYFAGISGTSAATPSFAGIMALVNQATHSRQGQANYVLYSLAASESFSQCNGSAGPAASTCIFNDITIGNNAVPGESGYGTSNPNYPAWTGYDLATGLGSVNVTNLVNSWNSGTKGSSIYTVPSITRLNIDMPGASVGAFAGPTTFSGWAVNNLSPITDVVVAVDGQPYGSATYSLFRPDVCVAYPNQAQCPYVGWSTPFDTTKLSNGSHQLEITATTADGNHGTVAANFTVGNYTTSNPTRINIDAPTTQTPSFQGSPAFGGWAMDDFSPVTKVAIAIDGVALGNATYGLTRNDVCTAFPGRLNCPLVGWNFRYDTALLTNGMHTFEAAATTADGRRSVVTSSFNVSNSAGAIKSSIDWPNSESPTVQGSVNFTGWALDDNAAIANVAASIDGVFYRNAIYGSNRPDVCAIFPGRAGCPNAGWYVPVDTTQLANGNHTFAILITSSLGEQATVSSSFKVANSGGPIRTSIDWPSPQSPAFQGSATFTGWALDDNAAIANIAVSIDGVPYSNGTYGTNRPDVCTIFPGRTGCPNVGWAVTVDTTGLSNGTHMLDIVANGADGSHATTTQAFTVSNWTAGNPMRVTIDAPGASSGPFQGTAGFGGWAIDDDAAISSVTVAVDGINKGTAAYGGNRADVCAAFPGRSGCPNVGWDFALDTTLLANGNHTLEITATSSNGHFTTIGRPFQVSNTSGPMRLTIDVPSPQSSYFRKSATFSGWAIDDNSAISSVAISVDGVLLGTAIYSLDRPDVCTVFPGRPGCPNVGWIYTLDTTLLSNGTHTLELTGTAEDGTHATITANFAVSN